MTETIGALSLIILLAFSMLILGLGGRAVRLLLGRSAMAARGPLALASVMALIVPISFLTWARSTLDLGFLSIGSFFDWAGHTLDANPLSWVCVGPLAIGLLASTLAPGPRKWITKNHLAISVATLCIAVIGGALALLIMTGGGWAILAVAVLLAVAIGLGSHGMVFVPRLDDGPRVGERTTAAVPRIASARARRTMYRTIDFATSTPRTLFSRDAAMIALVILTVAAIGIAYMNQPAAPATEPAVAATAYPTPTLAPAAARPTATPHVIAFKIANTNNEGVLLRDQPSREAATVGSLMEGATVEPAGIEVTEAEGITWRRVRSGNSTVGWVSAQYLDPVQSFGIARVANSSGDGVLLRSKPGKSGSQIGVARHGAELRVIGPDVQADGQVWRNVSDGKGTSGWISAEFLVPSGQ